MQNMAMQPRLLKPRLGNLYSAAGVEEADVARNTWPDPKVRRRPVVCVKECQALVQGDGRASSFAAATIFPYPRASIPECP